MITARTSRQHVRRLQPGRAARRHVMACLLVALSAAVTASGQSTRLDAERQKNLGVAYLEENRPVEAARAFRRVIELAPGEPLGYANLAIALLRTGHPNAAASQLEQARRQDPANLETLLLGAEIQLALGNHSSVLSLARKAIELDSRNLMARYYVYRAASANRVGVSDQKAAQRQITELQRIAPRNLVVQLRYARLLAQRHELADMTSVIDRVEALVEDTGKARRFLGEVRATVTGGDAERAAQSVARLENVLRPTSRYRQDLSQLEPPVLGLPIMRFRPAFYSTLQHQRPRRIALEFKRCDPNTIPPAFQGTWRATTGSLDVADADGDGRDDILVACRDDQKSTLGVWSSRAGTWTALAGDRRRVQAGRARFADWDNDGTLDIVAVGPSGLHWFQGAEHLAFRDRTAESGFTSEPAMALELIDADNEGDLDLAVSTSGGCRMWQNRGDGAARDVSERYGVAGAGSAAPQLLAIDFDDDLDTDLLVVDVTHHARMFANQRHGRFQACQCGLDAAEYQEVLARDLDNNGFEDIVLLAEDGRLCVQYNQSGSFTPRLIVNTGGLKVARFTLFDADNDGWLDVAAWGTRDEKAGMVILRNEGDGTWSAGDIGRPAASCLALDAWDLDRDGDLDLVVLEAPGTLTVWQNDGGNTNHWLRVRLKGLRTAGTKNNLHGIGSKLEVKSGHSYQLRFARREATWFGLGKRSQADLLRVVWSNGVPQNKLHPAADQTILEPQILKGSCPYLYCWDGTKFTFVTDMLAAAPLGLQVAEGVIAPDNPRELMTIPRDRIGLKKDAYVFQYTSELWETVYLDQVALWVVDHPGEFDVYTDQRFLPPPYAAPHPILTRRHRVPLRAQDTAGQEVTETLRSFDHRYPEQLVPTRYQGIVRPHTLTLDFGDASAIERPWLLLGGWIFWTDTSINVARSQSAAARPLATTLEVWDRQTGWRRLDEPFGLPCGKDKWVAIDLAGKLDSRQARVRIRSESQIYWDQAILADHVPGAPHVTTHLAACYADLHRGGFHRLYRPTDDGPHLYDYGERVDLPLWMDMSGMATRYGDVVDLLAAADDRYAIFTGGDEVTIRFDASGLPPLRPGWKRDFLFYNDGWEKDSDRNTVTGETVEPLPFHAMSAYPYPDDESYPGDAVHAEYIERYNTRPLGPRAFRRYVRDFRGGPPPPLPWALEPRVTGAHDK